MKEEQIHMDGAARTTWNALTRAGIPLVLDLEEAWSRETEHRLNMQEFIDLGTLLGAQD